CTLPLPVPLPPQQHDRCSPAFSCRQSLLPLLISSFIRKPSIHSPLGSQRASWPTTTAMAEQSLQQKDGHHGDGDVAMQDNLDTLPVTHQTPASHIHVMSCHLATPVEQQSREVPAAGADVPALDPDYCPSEFREKQWLRTIKAKLGNRHSEIKWHIMRQQRDRGPSTTTNNQNDRQINTKTISKKPELKSPLRNWTKRVETWTGSKHSHSLWAFFVVPPPGAGGTARFLATYPKAWATASQAELVADDLMAKITPKIAECLHQQLPHNIRFRVQSTDPSHHHAFQDRNGVRKHASGLAQDLAPPEPGRTIIERGIVLARVLTHRLTQVHRCLAPGTMQAMWQVYLDGLSSAPADGGAHPEPPELPIYGGKPRLLYGERHEGALRLKPSRVMAEAVGDFRLTINSAHLERLYPIIAGVHTTFLNCGDLKTAVLRAAGCTWVTNMDAFDGIGVYNQCGKPCEGLTDPTYCMSHYMTCRLCGRIKPCATMGTAPDHTWACRSCIHGQKTGRIPPYDLVRDFMRGLMMN
ncbi:uncharacterized protein B0I36DRAFT_415796, partial [Microdochium trichocladiopsis]